MVRPHLRHTSFTVFSGLVSPVALIGKKSCSVGLHCSVSVGIAVFSFPPKLCSSCIYVLSENKLFCRARCAPCSGYSRNHERHAWYASSKPEPNRFHKQLFSAPGNC